MPGHVQDSMQSCIACKLQLPYSEVVPARFVRPSLAEIIRSKFPDWNSDSCICHEDLNRIRSEYVERVLIEEKGELTALEQEVISSLQQHEIMARDVDAAVDREATFGERLADQMAEFGGSWTFLLLFGTAMVIWISLNLVPLLGTPFDPYPFILLNLVLSCLAAVQAPVIMMSQNRQEVKDRMRAENDYRVNLKAELEIRHLHSKIDLLLTHQWQRLLEIQQVQTDLLEEIGRQKGLNGNGSTSAPKNSNP